MGSAASKASRAATSTARRYPTTPPTTRPPPPPPPAPNHHPGPTVHPPARASDTRTDAIDLDASDPAFAASLRTLGPVQPNPTLSPSSTFSPSRPRAAPDPHKNPALAVLDARARLQNAAETESQRAGRSGFEGRQFGDVFVIREVLVKRDREGWAAERIERELGLGSGVVGRLGGRGMVEVASEQGRADREVHMV